MSSARARIAPSLALGRATTATALAFLLAAIAASPAFAQAVGEPGSAAEGVTPGSAQGAETEPAAAGEGAGQGPPQAIAEPDANTSAAAFLSLAEEAMTNLDYPRSRELAERAIARGGLGLDELTRAYRLIAVCSAQLDDTEAAERGFLRLFALAPSANLAMRLAPSRRSAVLTASGFWSVRKDAFGLEVDYARRERQIVVRVRDPIHWAKTVHVWWRFGDRKYQKATRPVASESLIEIEDIAATDALEVYAFVVDEHDNVLMQFGRDHDPHLFALTDDELAVILRRDIRGGQTGSFALRLEELGVQVGVHGYVSLELKPEGDVPSFDLHHATAMIRANLLSAVSVELAFEWEHLGLDQEDFYLPHAFLDVKLSDLLIVRGGFFEVPVGAFNEYLYPDFLRITGLPPLFSLSVVPALWSEVGLQLRGRIELRTALHLTYAAFVANGLEEKDKDPTTGAFLQGGDIREMRFNNLDTYSGDKAVGGRIGLEVGEFDFGVSGYTGRYAIQDDLRLSMLDADLSFRSEWLTVRTEGAVALQETTSKLLRKWGLYTLVAVRPLPALEPYTQYDFVDLGTWTQRALLGFAIYPFPQERATRNLRLKNEAGFEFPQGGGHAFVWFLQLTTGF
jgi:hypothetical protein